MHAITLIDVEKKSSHTDSPRSHLILLPVCQYTVLSMKPDGLYKPSV